MKDASGITLADSQALSADTDDSTKPNAIVNDGIDRRNFLSCMARAGTGLLWTMAEGVPSSRLFAATGPTEHGAMASSKSSSGFSFVQISDSHIGFNNAANQDVTGTLKLALDKINALPAHPEVLLHTGDIAHSSTTAA